PQVSIMAPPSGYVAAANAAITFSGTFTDAGSKDTHTAAWTFSSPSLAVPLTVPAGPTDLSEQSGSGHVNSTLTFSALNLGPGVYGITLTATDKDGDQGSASTVGGLPAFVVIYDPSLGFVTGGGWINSPPGAMPGNPTAQGQASFGFVARYKKGAS